MDKLTTPFIKVEITESQKKLLQEGGTESLPWSH